MTLSETEYGAVTPSTLVLHAGNSSDDFNSALKYQWAIVNDSLSLKDLGLSSADLTAETLVITAPSLIESVDLAVSLVVTEDRVGGLASKAVALTVQIDANNDAPIAIAGYSLAGNATDVETIAVEVGQTVTLDGSLSRDGDDGIASYAWSIADAGGTDVVFNVTPTGVVRSLIVPDAPAGAQVVVRLTVTDMAGQSTTDDLTLLVNPSDSELPVASAVLITNPIMEGSEGNVIRSTSTDDTGIATYKWTSNDPAITFTSDDRKDGVFSVAELAINPPSSEFVVTLNVTDLAGKTASADITVKVTLKLEPGTFKLKDGDDLLLEGKEYLSYIGGRTLELQIDEAVGTGAFTFTSSNTAVATVTKDGADHAVVTSGNTVGTTTITATQASDGVYAAVSKSFTFKAQAPNVQAPLQIMGVGFSLVGYEPEAYKDITFTLTTVGGSGTGKVVFSSDNTDAIEIDPDTGVVGVFNSGQATITATKQADGEFLAATATFHITVIPARRAVPDLVDTATGTRLNGTTYIAQRGQVLTLSITGEGSNDFNIYSSNESIAVASIDSPTDEVATVTFGGTEGSTTITVTHRGDNFYQEVETTFIYTVAPKMANSMFFEDAEGGIEVTAITCDSDCDSTQLIMKGYQNGGGTGGEFTFTSSNPDVVRVTGNTSGAAEVIGLKAGQSTITATRSADDLYDAVSVSFVYTVPLIVNTLELINAETGVDFAGQDSGYTGEDITLYFEGFQSGGGTGGVFTVVSSDDVGVVEWGQTRIKFSEGGKAGTTTITVTRSADDKYAAVSVSFTYTVRLITDNSLSIEEGTTGSSPPAMAFVGDAPINLIMVPSDEGGGSGGIYNITSDNPEVARLIYTAGSKTAVLEFVSAGTATITATRTADDVYAEAQASYTVTVGVPRLIFTDADGNEITEINVALLPEGSRTFDVFVKNPVTAAYGNFIKGGDNVFSAAYSGGANRFQIGVSGANYGTGTLTVNNYSSAVNNIIGAQGTISITVTEMDIADSVIPKPVIKPISQTEFTLGDSVELELLETPAPERDSGGAIIVHAWAIVSAGGNLTPVEVPDLAFTCSTELTVGDECTIFQPSKAGAYNLVARAKRLSNGAYVVSDPVTVTFIEPLKIVDADGSALTSINAFVGDEPFTLGVNDKTANVTFASNDTQVLQIDSQTGLFTIKSEGSAVITATPSGGLPPATVQVTVKHYSGAPLSVLDLPTANLSAVAAPLFEQGTDLSILRASDSGFLVTTDDTEQTEILDLRSFPSNISYADIDWGESFKFSQVDNGKAYYGRRDEATGNSVIVIKDLINTGTADRIINAELSAATGGSYEKVVKVSGGRIYSAQFESGTLRVFDTNTTASTISPISMKTFANGYSTGFEFIDTNTLIRGSHPPGSPGGRITIVDISDINNTTLLDSVTTEDYWVTYVNGALIHLRPDNLGAIVTREIEGNIFVSESTTTLLPSTRSFSYGEGNGNDNYLYMRGARADGTGSAIFKIDIRDPRTPVLVGEYYNEGEQLRIYEDYAITMGKAVNFYDTNASLHLINKATSAVRATTITYPLKWDEFVNDVDDIQCHVTSGSCSVTAINWAARTATLNWTLSAAVGEQQVQVSIGGDSFYTSDFDRIIVK